MTHMALSTQVVESAQILNLEASENQTKLWLDFSGEVAIGLIHNCPSEMLFFQKEKKKKVYEKYVVT